MPDRASARPAMNAVSLCCRKSDIWQGCRGRLIRCRRRAGRLPRILWLATGARQRRCLATPFPSMLILMSASLMRLDEVDGCKLAALIRAHYLGLAKPPDWTCRGGRPPNQFLFCRVVLPATRPQKYCLTFYFVPCSRSSSRTRNQAVEPNPISSRSLVLM